MITVLCAAPAYLQKCPGSTRDGHTQTLRPVDFKEMTIHMLYIVAVFTFPQLCAEDVGPVTCNLYSHRIQSCVILVCL